MFCPVRRARSTKFIECVGLKTKKTHLHICSMICLLLFYFTTFVLFVSMVCPGLPLQNNCNFVSTIPCPWVFNVNAASLVSFCVAVLELLQKLCVQYMLLLCVAPGEGQGLQKKLIYFFVAGLPVNIFYSPLMTFC